MFPGKLMRRLTAGLFAAALFFGLNSASLKAEEPLSAQQKQAVEGIVKDYIEKNPEIIVRAFEAMQAKQQAEKQRQVQQRLASLKEPLNRNPSSPVIGNAKGDITVVEFFDYRCGYCKRVFPTVEKLLKENGNVRYVLKEFPILGPQSVLAARASLATWKLAPKKYVGFHSALMMAKGQLTEKKIMTLAGQSGIDTKALTTAMQDPAVEKEIRNNMQLAEALGINGTPAFIVGEHVVPGAIDFDTLSRLVKAAGKG